MLALRVEAQIFVPSVQQSAGNHTTAISRILRDLAERRLECPAEDVYAAPLVVIDGIKAIQR